MANSGSQTSSIGKDVAVYLCILALAAIQFLIAYEHIDASQMLVRMMIVALLEAGLALFFFMHLGENRGLLWFVIIFTGFVLVSMQFGWTDSFRLSGGVPWAR